MYQKTDLLRDLQNLNIDPHGTLLIHSSMKKIGEVAGGADTVLDVFSTYMQEGLLVFPTHSWMEIHSEAKDPVFRVGETPSCVGILGNLFMKRPGVLRSLHPTHSVAALGRDAAAFLAGEETRNTPCPRGGCWGRLYDRKATILFLGCTLRSNTFLHCVEEWNQIPDRLRDTPYRVQVIDTQGNSYMVDMHGHYSTKGDVSQWYDKMEKPFASRQAIRYGTFGDAACVIADAVQMGDITTAYLQKHPDLFSDPREVPEGDDVSKLSKE